MADDACDLLCLDLSVAETIRAHQPGAEVVEKAASGAAALADPTRLGVAAALSEAPELCVCDLAWVVGRSQGLVGHHLKVLRHAGLVSSRREGKMVMYALTERGRTLLSAVVDGAATPAR